MKENWQVHWQDYYKILQIDQSAEIEVVKAAYGKLAFKYHPDRNSSSNATGQMILLNEAFDIISNPVKRAVYDANYQQIIEKPIKRQTVSNSQTTSSQTYKNQSTYTRRQTRQEWEQHWNERMGNATKKNHPSSSSPNLNSSHTDYRAKTPAGNTALTFIGVLGTPIGLIYGIIKYFTATPKHHLIYFVPAILTFIAFLVAVFRTPSRNKRR